MSWTGFNKARESQLRQSLRQTKIDAAREANAKTQAEVINYQENPELFKHQRALRLRKLGFDEYISGDPHATKKIGNVVIPPNFEKSADAEKIRDNIQSREAELRRQMMERFRTGGN